MSPADDKFREYERLATKFLQYKFHEGEDTPTVPVFGKLTFNKVNQVSPAIIQMAVAMMTEFVAGCMERCMLDMLCLENGWNHLIDEINEEREYYGLPKLPMHRLDMKPLPNHVAQAKPKDN